MLTITADDYGYCPAYDAGILAAARAGALDAVSCFSQPRAAGAGDPAPLLETGVELGLHLALETGGRGRASPEERREAAAALRAQHAELGERLGRPPAYLDGHHHCHAQPGLGVVVAEFAAARGLPVRSIDGRHRRLLRCRGIATADLLVGRLDERQPPLPAELAPEAVAALPAAATIEWMVHPGEPDASCGSSYDAGRGQDLELLLSWRPPQGLRRGDHAAALGVDDGAG